MDSLNFNNYNNYHLNLNEKPNDLEAAVILANKPRQVIVVDDSNEGISKMVNQQLKRQKPLVQKNTKRQKIEAQIAQRISNVFSEPVKTHPIEFVPLDSQKVNEPEPLLFYPNFMKNKETSVVAASSDFEVNDLTANENEAPSNQHVAKENPLLLKREEFVRALTTLRSASKNSNDYSKIVTTANALIQDEFIKTDEIREIFAIRAKAVISLSLWQNVYSSLKSGNTNEAFFWMYSLLKQR